MSRARMMSKDSGKNGYALYKGPDEVVKDAFAGATDWMGFAKMPIIAFCVLVILFWWIESNIIAPNRIEM
jgi:hypothetical protein